MWLRSHMQSTRRRKPHSYLPYIIICGLPLVFFKTGNKILNCWLNGEEANGALRCTLNILFFLIELIQQLCI